MSILIKRYLVENNYAKYCIQAEQALDAKFSELMRNTVPGQNNVTVTNYAFKQTELINSYNKKRDQLYAHFVQKTNIAPSLSSVDFEPVTFDNTFGWEISFHCNILAQRLLMQINSANPAKFPLKTTPSFLKELTDEEYFILKGD